MGITGGIACFFLIVVIGALIVFWLVRYAFGPKQPKRADEVLEESPPPPPPPPPDDPTPPQHPRGRR
ncbi:hypothetical protein [Micromonospora sp. CB01531]|uniref:hypothetical protein n=1 Tax=Micromonospora sp. CB01531 TaxID=1718947 RepID=UPI001161331B|nr:hypothetical protein [Micromonospora sp. CB01531]